MTYPVAALIADLLHPPSGDPGYTSIDHTAIRENGSTVPGMLQTIVPIASTSMLEGWQTVWFRDARFAGGAFTDLSGNVLEGVFTHFKLPPGPDQLWPEYYGKMTTRGGILDVRSRLVRVYASKPDNPTAEKALGVGGNNRWSGGIPSMTYPKAVGSSREPEFLVRIELRVEISPTSSPVPTFVLDNRYPKWLNANELVGQRVLVG